MEAEKDILKKHITSDFKQEVPSIDFTQLVMEKVQNTLEEKTVVEPLISKRAWLWTLIIAACIVLISFGVDLQQSDVTWFDSLGFQMPDLEKFKTTIYLSTAIVSILGIMTVADMFYRRRRQFS